MVMHEENKGDQIVEADEDGSVDRVGTKSCGH